MQIRRCAVLMLEPRETLEFDLGLLLQGESGLRSTLRWLALAPHLDAEVEVDAAGRELLGALGETAWTDSGAIAAQWGEATLARLLELGLLIGDGAEHAQHRVRDEKLRGAYWRPLSAVAHYFSRWRDVDAAQVGEETGIRSVRDMVEKLGAPPPHFHDHGPAEARIALPPPRSTPLDELLARRVTCRNFDTQRAIELPLLADLLHRVYAAQGTLEAAPGATVLKKTSPSGGGLHPIEPWLIVRHVDGLAPGLYHYHTGVHALEPVDAAAAIAAAVPEPDDPDAPPHRDALWRLANRCVAGQHWFADAPVLVVLAVRFARSFWKYRNHAKAYRAVVLDAGHLSQTLYVSATEHGLGAFVTAATNEHVIEQAFGFDPLEHSPLAVCGFGWRGAQRDTVEFDPLHRVWRED
ncbi:MAG TPA: putative peptide maturation dehydrogenase [Xanthomonadaceae bacterium]|nr:putative peptide maturation dehydrogenase [Xanthomonadaceae bacterium]